MDPPTSISLLQFLRLATGQYYRKTDSDRHQTWTEELFGERKRNESNLRLFESSQK